MRVIDAADSDETVADRGVQLADLVAGIGNHRHRPPEGVLGRDGIGQCGLPIRLARVELDPAAGVQRIEEVLGIDEAATIADELRAQPLLDRATATRATRATLPASHVPAST